MARYNVQFKEIAKECPIRTLMCRRSGGNEAERGFTDNFRSMRQSFHRTSNGARHLLAVDSFILN